MRDGRLLVSDGNKRHDIPRGSLRHCFTKLGHKATLTKNQETELCSRTFRLGEVEYPLTPKILKLNVFQFCNENGISHRF